MLSFLLLTLPGLDNTALAGEHSSITSVVNELTDWSALVEPPLRVGTSDPAMLTVLRQHPNLQGGKVEILLVQQAADPVAALGLDEAGCGIWLEQASWGWLTRPLGTCPELASGTPAGSVRPSEAYAQKQASSKKAKDLAAMRRRGYIAGGIGTGVALGGGVVAAIGSLELIFSSATGENKSGGAGKFLLGSALFLHAPSAGHHVVGAHAGAVGWSFARLGGLGVGALVGSAGDGEGGLGPPLIGWGVVTVAQLADIHFAARRVQARQERPKGVAMQLAPTVPLQPNEAPGLSLAGRW